MYTASASFKQNLDIFEFKNITLQIKIWTDHHCHRVPKIERVSKCVQTFEHIMDTFWTLRCILDTLFKKKFFKHSVQNVSKLLDTIWTLRGAIVSWGHLATRWRGQPCYIKLGRAWLSDICQHWIDLTLRWRNSPRGGIFRHRGASFAIAPSLLLPPSFLQEWKSLSMCL